MTDTRERTQQEQARELARDLERHIEVMDRLQGLNGRADDAYDEMHDEIAERPLCADLRITIDVTLGTGGPASGVEFDCERETYGLDWTSARVWHQDWFTSRGYAELDTDTAQRLWDIWGLETTQIGDDR